MTRQKMCYEKLEESSIVNYVYDQKLEELMRKKKDFRENIIVSDFKDLVNGGVMKAHESFNSVFTSGSKMVNEAMSSVKDGKK